MKSMKRMLSLLLVALLLVSAVPMMASAEAAAGEFGGAGEMGGAPGAASVADATRAAGAGMVGATGELGGGSGAASGEAGLLTGNLVEQTRQNQEPVAPVNTDTPTSITVHAVLITHDDSQNSNTRTLTIDEPFSPNATLGDVLRGESGLNQSARTNGISEYQKYNYRYRVCPDSTNYNQLDQYGATDSVDTSLSLSSISSASTIYLQFYRTRKTATVGLELNGSTYGKKEKVVPLYSTLNLPAEFSTAKLAPNTGYYIAYYEDAEHTDRGPITSPNSYLITEDTTIVGYQDLLANKPINEGNVNTSGGSGSNNGSGSGSNNGSVGSITGSGSSSNNGSYNKFPYNVYLNIYKNTMVGAPDKTINITNGAAIDGTVTMDEVKALVMNHYKAKDSYGISFDGLYLAEGTWVTNYVTDTEKYDKFVNVDQLRQDHTVYVNVMIGNATAKSSSSGTADTSNPKTGDSIYAPIAVLGVSATALAAAMFFYNKKRLAK